MFLENYKHISIVEYLFYRDNGESSLLHRGREEKGERERKGAIDSWSRKDEEKRRKEKRGETEKGKGKERLRRG